MKRWLKITGVAVVVLGVAAFGVKRFVLGPTGATTAVGGSLEAKEIPDFPSADPARWVNGEPRPLAGLRGSVVFIEAWSPG